MAKSAYEPRLKKEYVERIRAAMQEKFSYANEMQIPRLDKIVINMGVGRSTGDSRSRPLLLPTSQRLLVRSR